MCCSVWPTVCGEQSLKPCAIPPDLGKAVEKDFLLDQCHSCVREGGAGYCCLVLAHGCSSGTNDE